MQVFTHQVLSMHSFAFQPVRLLFSRLPVLFNDCPLTLVQLCMHYIQNSSPHGYSDHVFSKGPPPIPFQLEDTGARLSITGTISQPCRSPDQLREMQHIFVNRRHVQADQVRVLVVKLWKKVFLPYIVLYISWNELSWVHLWKANKHSWPMQYASLFAPSNAAITLKQCYYSNWRPLSMLTRSWTCIPRILSTLIRAERLSLWQEQKQSPSHHLCCSFLLHQRPMAYP